MNRRALLGGTVAAGALLVSAPLRAQAAGLDEDRIDAIVAGFMAAQDIPGMGISIIRPGAPDLAKGYGVRTLGKADRVDVDTLFGIGSNSKAFTAAALALLVDEGKICWEDPVVRYLPEFRMYDPDVTRMMTIRDLLVHRSGLSLGAGDLMFWPGTTHSVEDVLHGLQFLKPNKGFRTGYAYDNVLYIVAGVLLQRVTGQSWEAFVTGRLLKPLGMGRSVPALSLVKTPNVAGRHARLGPPVSGFGPVVVVKANEDDKVDAAGGINASARDILAWFHVQLANGKLPGGGRLWSEQQSGEMWKPQTITQSGPGSSPELPTASVMEGYALGWFVSTYRGERILFHAGGLIGQVTQHALLPERGIAVAVYSNSENNPLGLRNALLDQLLETPGVDWLARAVTRRKAAETAMMKELGSGVDNKPPLGALSLPLRAYEGRYSDPWYGDIIVTMKRGRLHIEFTRTPAFKGPLEPWGKDSFRTRFPKEAGEDAVVTFAVTEAAVSKVTMKAFSPSADFSYDFQDLTFLPRR